MSCQGYDWIYCDVFIFGQKKDIHMKISRPNETYKTYNSVSDK